MGRATSQAHSAGSFQFSPTTSAVTFPKPRDIANRSPGGNKLDILNLSDNLEIHSFIWHKIEYTAIQCPAIAAENTGRLISCGGFDDRIQIARNIRQLPRFVNVNFSGKKPTGAGGYFPNKRRVIASAGLQENSVFAPGLNRSTPRANLVQ